MEKIKTSSKKLLAKKATNKMVMKGKRTEQLRTGAKTENKKKRDLMKISRRKNRSPKKR